jgi:hypothetical protein
MGRRGLILLLLSKTRIERVPKAVTQEVEAEDYP